MMKAFSLHPQTEQQTIPVLLILLVFSFGLLMACSGSSPLHPYSLHFDTSWFFLAGKAWMNGLTPYVDFSDSKGPLLWLIYGIGYLISPYSYDGVFIVEVLSYWLTFYLLYKTAALFINSAPRALLASMLMGFLFFYPGQHQETRIEDFSHLFNAAALYILLQSLYFGRYKRVYALLLGVSCGCMLMMKYSYFLTLLVPSGMIFLFLIVKKDCWVDFLFKFIIGNLIIVVPFLIYFILFADLGAFINEYFLNTGSTVLNIWDGYEEVGSSPFQPNHRWPLSIGYLFIREHYLSYFMTLIFVGEVIGIYLLRKSNWAAWTIILWYTLSVLLFSIMGVSHPNYYMNLCIFGFSLPLIIIYPLRRMNMGEAILGGGVVVGLMAVIVTFYIYSEHAYAFRDKFGYESVGEIVDIINERERQLGRKPTIAYQIKEYEKGEHVRTNAMPGMKYWSVQAGMTEDMKRQFENDLYTLKPDFVFAKENEMEERRQLEEAGYRLVKVYTAVYPIIGYTPPNSCLYMFDHPE